MLSILAILLQPAYTQQIDHSSWVGIWKLDRSASHFAGLVVAIHRLPHRYRFDIRGTTIEVGDDGKDYATVPTRTTSFQQIKVNEWRRIHKINGIEVDSSTFILSPDNRSFVIHTVAIDQTGEKHASDETFQRQNTGLGIDGVWRSSSAGINVPERLEIVAAEGGGLRFTYPTEGLSFVSPLNGSTVSYSGPHAIPTLRVAVSTISSMRLRRIDFLQGKPYQEGTETLSPDSQRLTEVSWNVASPAEKDEAVYRRQR